MKDEHRIENTANRPLFDKLDPSHKRAARDRTQTFQREPYNQGGRFALALWQLMGLGYREAMDNLSHILERGRQS
jgi:hypothetical protein